MMDYDPARREQNMARWTFTGGVAYVLGPLALTAAIAVGMGWRGAFMAIVLLTLPAIVAAYRLPLGTDERGPDRDTPSIGEGIRTAVRALKRFRVVRWLALLQASDLMLGIFTGFLALYMVDIAGVSESRAALTVAAWAGASVIGELFVIFVLERVRGLTYLRYSVIVVLLLYPAFLLAPSFEIKLVIAGPAGIRERGVVLHTSGASLLLAAGKERYYRRAWQRLWHSRLGGPVGAWSGLGDLGTGHGDVAAPGGAGGSADRPRGEWDAVGERKNCVGWNSPRRDRRAQRRA